MLSILKKLVTNSGIYFLGSVFQKSISFLLIPLYTFYLGTVDYGIIGLMSITIGLISNLISPPVITGFVRHYHSPDYKDTKEKLLFSSFIVVVSISVIFAFFFYIARNILCSVLLDSNEFINIVKLYTFVLLFQPISQFLDIFLRQNEKAKEFVVISNARFIVTSGCILFLLVYLKLGLLSLIYGGIIGNVFSITCTLPFFWKSSTHTLSLSLMRQPLRYGYALLLQAFSMFFIQLGDRYVLKALTNISTVGLYSFGCNFAEIIGAVFIVPFKFAFQPLMLQQEGDPKKIRLFLSTNCTYFYLIGMFLCLLLSILSKEIIQLMARREEYWSCWIIVPIVSFSSLQHGLGYFFNQGLNLTKKVRYINANVVIAAIVNLGFNFILIPTLGILGAALSTLLSYLVWNGSKIYFSYRFYSLTFEYLRLFYITAIGGGLYIISFIIADTDILLTNLFIKTFIIFSYPLFFIKYFFTEKETLTIKTLWRDLQLNGFKSAYSKITTYE